MNESNGRTLLTVARAAIVERFGAGKSSPIDSDEPELRQQGCSFVTLWLGRELRGCVGSLRVRRPLIEDVAENARSAAFEDSRFPSLKSSEFGQITIEVSVLSPLEAVRATSRKDLLRQLRPGIDGVLLESGAARATFLPQVWANLPEPAEFLHALAAKAGLPPDAAPPDLDVWRYTVSSWTED